MANRDGDEGLATPRRQLERELARERQARSQHDAVRAGLAPQEEELRLKDARERADTCGLKRRPER
ncbi:hypothetical protein LE190_11305 [Massilia oculi]|uniref:Uncharacterized protein n=1 Tax=Massilia hydrophila TaxID=3044279 RepID=A0ABS7Y9X8_9BURK|nr:hypothetical protein [Massilia oculi]MCA1856503.1 hypothetical protein [Massilia oculi]